LKRCSSSWFSSRFRRCLPGFSAVGRPRRGRWRPWSRHRGTRSSRVLGPGVLRPLRRMNLRGVHLFPRGNKNCDDCSKVSFLRLRSRRLHLRLRRLCLCRSRVGNPRRPRWLTCQPRVRAYRAWRIRHALIVKPGPSRQRRHGDCARRNRVRPRSFTGCRRCVWMARRVTLRLRGTCFRTHARRGRPSLLRRSWAVRRPCLDRGTDLGLQRSGGQVERSSGSSKIGLFSRHGLVLNSGIVWQDTANGRRLSISRARLMPSGGGFFRNSPARSRLL